MAAVTPIKAPSEPSRKDKIDRYGVLDLKLQRMAPEMAEHKALKAELLAAYESLPGDRTASEDGVGFTIQVGLRDNERKIVDQSKCWKILRKIIGLEALVAAVTIRLATIDESVPESQHGEFLVKARTGSRKLVAVPREPAAA